MVSVRGQLDAPLLDIGQVEKEYWERKTVLLPSLKKFNKPKGWRRWLYKPQPPKIVITRLTAEDWNKIDGKFFTLKEELARDGKKLREITKKLTEDAEMITEDEWTFLARAKIKAAPIYIGMLELMIEEPKMDYDQVQKLWDCLDNYDRETLATYVNMLSSEQMGVAQEINKQRIKEMDDARSKVMVETKGLVTR
tara:strand:- start:1738 stop:2322 length:585 start_codon:yes stop_codon:yes gene_type:complete